MSDNFDNSNLYEGLFLMNQAAIGAGIGAAIDHVREGLEKIDAQVITLRKWEDRKLSYTVKRQKRGIYLLAMFRADGTRLAEAENRFNLSEQVLRMMVTKCDHMGQVEYDAELEEAKTSEAELKLREQADEAKSADAAKPAKPAGKPVEEAKPAAEAPAEAAAEPAAAEATE